MDPRTDEMLQYALTAPLGFYEQADTIVRLLTSENVDEIMRSLPAEVCAEFMRFARDAYVPRGPRFAVKGSVVPESCLEALRAWLAARDLADALDLGQYFRAYYLARSADSPAVTGPLRDQLTRLRERALRGLDAAMSGAGTSPLPTSPPPQRPEVASSFAGY